MKPTDSAHGRVVILEHALPVDVATRLEERASWLRQQLQSLDQDMAVACPPIDIVPVCWQTTTGGERLLVAGRLSWRCLEHRHRFVVEVTAPTLLEYPDDFVLGIVAHEFLHIVHETIRRNRADRLREWFGVLALPEPVEPGAYSASWESYRRIDRALQARPESWLSERLQQLEALSEQPQDEAGARVQRHWIARSLPVETVETGFFPAGSLWLDPAIIDLHDLSTLKRAYES